ncbi:MAG: nucleotidyltransferase family protein [Myxococcales bacterium]|nr:nucleotidyltransferase family protein [Myxococcales bacterium]
MDGELLRIFAALEESGARYLVVGGVGVVLHGHPRMTADLDLVVQLEPTNARVALQVLEGLGYRPRAPVPAVDFADPEKRRQWVEEKGLVVFSLWNPSMPMTEIDLFVEEPFPFDEAYSRALVAALGAVEVRVASPEDLVDLKRRAGRPKDLEDIRALEQIYGKLGPK